VVEEEEEEEEEVVVVVVLRDIFGLINQQNDLD